MFCAIHINDFELILPSDEGRDPKFWPKTEKNLSSFENWKKSLGLIIERMSEQDIVLLYELQNRIADALFDKWLRKRNNVGKDVQS